MKILSEKTNKYYSTVDECIAAEKEYDEKIAKEKAEKEAKEKALAVRKEAALTERKERANEVEEAYKAVLKAQKAYREKLNTFVKDYGSFHMTLRTGDLNPFDAFESFFDNFWL